ncbi:MAG: hypothetical protein IBJ11_09955, partial [Phycisphaerales bacterium]|nr:hypothetical protein [Phycisphaerales bacterium]
VGGSQEQVRIGLRRTGAAVNEAGVTALRVRVQPTGAPGRGASAADLTRASATATVRWQPGQTEASATVQLPPDALRAEEEPAGGAAPASSPGALRSRAILAAEIDRDALAADNIFRRPVTLAESIQVGVVAQRRFGGPAGIDRLPPGEWLKLALEPLGSGAAGAPVEIVEIEPASVDTPTLAGLSAVFLPSPDVVPAEAWGRLRRFVDAGGLLVVSPPAEATVHLWSDAFTKAFEVPWRLAREALVSPEDRPFRLQPPSGAGGAAAGPGAGPGAGPSAPVSNLAGRPGVLSLIAAELPDLLKPVSVRRVLPLEETPKDAEVVLTFDDPSAPGRVRPWIVAAEPGEGASGKPDRPDAGTGAARGLVVYMASPLALSWTDLPAKPFVIPLLQELVRQGVGRSVAAASAVAGRGLSAPIGARRVRMIAEAGGAAAPPAVEVDASGTPRQPVRTAGVYEALDEADRRLRGGGLIVVNPDADAGRVTPQPAAAVRAWLGAAAASGRADAPGAGGWLDEATPALAQTQGEHQSPVSLPLLIAAFVLAVIEVFLARWFSHAYRDAPSGAAPAAEGAA